jgi:hypothetical protein
VAHAPKALRTEEVPAGGLQRALEHAEANRTGEPELGDLRPSLREDHVVEHDATWLHG